MRKILVILLAAALALGCLACAPIEAEPVPYEPAKEISVTATFVENGIGKFATRAEKDAGVKDIEVACLYFDEEGNALKDVELIACEITDGDLLNIWEVSVPSGCAYLAATVAAVTTDTKTSCPGVDTWAEETVAAFSPNAYEQSLKAMRKKNLAAKYDMVSYSFKSWDNSVLKYTVKNETEKDMDSVHLYVLYYDKDGKPVSTGSNLCSNSKILESLDLKAGEEATFTVSVPEGSAGIKAVIDSITYADGEVFQNPYIYEWLISNYQTGPEK